MAKNPTASTPSVDGYHDLELVGSGGFSAVYRATQSGMAREVAIKVLNIGFDDERQQRTFERECQVMGRLSRHPHIVTVFQQAATDLGQPCIVMELYRETCRERIDRLGVFSIEEVLDLGVKVADALHTVHGEGILHRDIKPHNIFLSAYDSPALADFGISSVSEERTITGGGGFSLDYSPPEVLDEGQASAESDVYSLGATLFHMASGHVPFPHTGDSGSRLRSTIRRIITEPPPALERHDAPGGLTTLLRSTMAKDMADRPGSALELAHALQAVQADLGHTPTTLQSPSPSADSNTIARSSITPEITTATAHREKSRQSADAPAEDPNEDQTFTIARSRPRAASESETPPTTAPLDAEVRSRRRRGLLAAVGVAAMVTLAIIVAAVLIGGGEESDDVPVTSSTLEEVVVTILRPPEGVVATRDGDDVTLTWQEADAAEGYLVELVGTDETRESPAPQFTWEDAPADRIVCYVVYTTAEFRISRSPSDQACVS